MKKISILMLLIIVVLFCGCGSTYTFKGKIMALDAIYSPQKVKNNTKTD